jgi:predicted phosphodiesterase
MPRATLDLLATRGDRVRFLRGNCDREMATVLDQPPDPTQQWEPIMRWAAEHVTPAQRAMLGALPTTVSVAIDGVGPTLFCHGSPRDDNEIITKLSPESRLAPMLAGVREGVVVCGHTHIQFDRRVLGKRLLNAGSVGAPYGAAPGAYWTLFGPEVTPVCTPYDLERAARAIEASGYIGAESFVKQLRAPMSADEASQKFETMAQERERAAASSGS